MVRIFFGLIYNSVKDDLPGFSQIGHAVERRMFRQDEPAQITGLDNSKLFPVTEAAGAIARRRVDNRKGGKPGAFHQLQFAQKTERVRHAVGTSVAASNDLHAHRVSIGEAGGVLIKDALKIRNNRGVPTHDVGVVHLFLDWRESGNPGDLPVAHPSELIFADKEAVLD